MNSGSMLKLFSAGWQAPQVRPLLGTGAYERREKPA